MTPELALFAIKALIRVGQQTDRALIEWGADRDAPFPNALEFKLRDQQMALRDLLREQRYAHLRTEAPFVTLWEDAQGGNIKNQAWTNLGENAKKAVIDKAAAAAAKDPAGLAILVLESAQRSEAGNEHGIGLALIQQWKDENKPASPVWRVVLALAQVGLDYVAVDPSIVGVGGSRGEAIMKSFAAAVVTPLTQQLDADNLGDAAHFFDNALKVMLGAALDAFKANTDAFVSDKHLSALVGNALDPVIAAAKSGDVPFQRRLQQMFDALLGPAATAAMNALAANPSAFFGSGLDSTKAAGAIVGALLLEAAKGGDIRNVFDDRGLVTLLTAALDVVAQRPELFVSLDDQAKATLTKDVIASLATALKPELGQLPATRTINPQRIASALAAAAIEAVGRNAAAITGNANQRWHLLVTDLSRKIFVDVAAALRDPNQGPALQKLLSEQQLIELGRIAVQAVAASPGLLGSGDAAVRAVISAIATAMAADKRLLLKPDDWLELARTMVKEIAAHPSTIAGSDRRLQAVVEILGTVIAGDAHSVLNGTDVAQISQVLLSEIAGSPALLAGLKPELAIVAQTVAKAMASDPNRLLSGTDWAEILKIAAAEASANPARLFGVNHNNATQALAAEVLALVLKTIPGAIPAGGPLILKGEVLREAMVILLRHAAGTPDIAKKYLPLLQSAVKEITDFVAANSGRYGSKELLSLIRIVSAQILAGKHDAQLALILNGQAVRLLGSVSDADALLAGGA